MKTKITDEKNCEVREFHINDLPKKELYFILKESFRKKFFKRLYKLIGGSTKLSRKLPVQDEAIRRWKVGERSIPNWALLELNNLLEDKKFTIEEIEKNIIAYKGQSSNRPITNPNIPIVEDKRLIKIVTHLLCDGYDGGRRHLPTYNNTEKELIDDLIKDLSVFGNVPYKIIEYDKGWKSAKLLYRVEFPRIITHILRHIYKIKFHGDIGRLPKIFLNLKSSLGKYSIQAFADDESNVKDSKISFGLKNFKLLQDFRELAKIVMNLGSDDMTKIKKDYGGREMYFFQLNRKALDKYHNEIGFNHPNKKILLDAMIKRGTKPGNKYPEGVAREKILDLLLEEPSTSIDLSLKLGIKSKNIRWHLEKLKKTNKIILSHVANYGSKVWMIKK